MPYSYGCLALKYWCAESENKGQRKRLLHILQRPSEDYPNFAGDNATDTLCWRCLIRAYEFMEKFRHGFCDDLCQRAKYTVVKCPARQLAEFLEWFHKEITEANA